MPNQDLVHNVHKWTKCIFKRFSLGASRFSFQCRLGSNYYLSAVKQSFLKVWVKTQEDSQALFLIWADEPKPKGKVSVIWW